MAPEAILCARQIREVDLRLLDLLKSHMGVVASYKQLIQFYSTVPEDDLRSKKASSYKREDVIIQILNSWYTCLELIDVTKEPRLHIGIKNAIPRISYLWDAHEKSGQPMADACFDDADQFLVEMSELLSE